MMEEGEMKIYLCGRFSRRPFLLMARGDLHTLGHVVTSRWLDSTWTDEGREDTPAPVEAAKEDLR